MCKFTSTIFLEEVFHNCVHPQEVANKKTPWMLLTFVSFDWEIGNRWEPKLIAVESYGFDGILQPWP